MRIKSLMSGLRGSRVREEVHECGTRTMSGARISSVEKTIVGGKRFGEGAHGQGKYISKGGYTSRKRWTLTID